MTKYKYSYFINAKLENYSSNDIINLNIIMTFNSLPDENSIREIKNKILEENVRYKFVTIKAMTLLGQEKIPSNKRKEI